MRIPAIPPPVRTVRIVLTLVAAALVAFAAAQSSDPADDYAPDVSYTLTTGLAGGKMAFIGAGGPIDGVVNPELSAEPGDLVQITLVNGDGVVHDLKVGGIEGAQTDEVTEKGASSVIAFRAEEAGSFEYWCTIPGHRAAGMEGSFTVGEAAAEQETLDSIVRLPTDVPDPIGDRDGPVTHEVTLTTTEKVARLADGTSYRFWTFNDRVPGPLLRVRVGDTVDVTLENPADSRMSHSVDFHAATGPGGGAVATQTPPGESTRVSFKALQPGLFVYHCATPMVAHHITNGMYGLILVEPEDGLSEVDREFYVMQGELYTAQDYGTSGAAEFSVEKLLDEDPEYFVFNGAVGALSQEAPLAAEVGETVRIFFGVGGPNATSSFHVIGEIFERVYDQASLTSPPLTDVQTTTVAPGGATMVEFGVEVPGDYVLVDHALSRAERGLVGILQVSGAEAPSIFDPGAATGDAGH